MWSAVVGWFRGILEAVNTLFGWFFKLFLLWAARRSGRRDQEQKYKDRALDIKDKQLEIANRPKYRARELLERARLRNRR